MGIEWKREELAWAGGLFEGEGCFSRNNKVPVATIGMTDEDVLMHFAVIMGFGKIYPFDRHNPGTNGVEWKSGLQWMTTTFEHTQATVAALRPWLGERRRSRASELLLGYGARLAANARGDGTLAGELFGKRATDLTPAEYTEYRRVQVARNRAARGVTSGHDRTTDPNPRPR